MSAVLRCADMASCRRHRTDTRIASGRHIQPIPGAPSSPLRGFRMNGTDLTRGYTDGDVDTNATRNRDLGTIVAERYSRRQTLLGGLGASTAAFFGTTLLAACDFGDSDSSGSGFTVSAGNSGATTSGNLVRLTGTQVAGSASAVQWTQVGGPAVTLSGAA